MAKANLAPAAATKSLELLKAAGLSASLFVQSTAQVAFAGSVASRKETGACKIYTNSPRQ